MKTTLEIPDELFRQAKAKAAIEGRRLKDLVTEGLRIVTSQPVEREPVNRVEFPIIRNESGAPKVSIPEERLKELEIQADLDRNASSL